MARRRHTPEQIIRKLREADRLLAEGAEIADVARHLEVSEQTYHRWRNQFGAAPVNLFEAGSCGNHCVVVVSSPGLLIQTAAGSFGGAGGFRAKRSGCSA
jgi:transposase-like protein